MFITEWFTPLPNKQHLLPIKEVLKFLNIEAITCKRN